MRREPVAGLIGRRRPPGKAWGAAGFAAASLLAFGAAFRNGAFVTSLERSVLVGTSGLSLILLLSEISFRARIFDLQMPQMSGGGEFDGGHDIVILLVRLLSDAGRTGLLVAVTGVALLVAAAIPVWTKGSGERQVYTFKGFRIPSGCGCVHAHKRRDPRSHNVV
ncbi:hypothetical protein [Rhizobium azibense]|uniref:hypothetical protein n=1 Tax=Rhizobium azibense TaxID=1136135 RepID=UPI00104A7E46|nr:hypothetical protein [Rhizobium azibense]